MEEDEEKEKEGKAHEEQDEESDGYVLGDCAHSVHIQVLGVIVPIGNEAESNRQVDGHRCQKTAAYEDFVLEGGVQ
jgi:hypothetical protein